MEWAAIYIIMPGVVYMISAASSVILGIFRRG